MIKHPKLQIFKGIWLVGLIGLLASLQLSACGATQAAPKVYRIGILSGVDSFIPMADGFKAKMTELGYVEGEDVTYDLQRVSNISNDQAKAEEILNKFVADDVDLIFTFPTGAAEMAKAATAGTNIPVVFANTAVEGNDLVKSVREPGGNLTGVRSRGPDLAPKRLEFLHQIVPQAKKVLLLHNPDYPTSVGALKGLEPVAPGLGIELVVAPIKNVDDIKASLQQQVGEAGQLKVEAILIMSEPVNQSAEGWKAISTFAADHNLPVGGIGPLQAEQGAIFSYTPNNVEVGRLAAPLADKILHGIPAGTIPVVTPEAWLLINYKRAQKLGLTVPEGLLKQANEIIR